MLRGDAVLGEHGAWRRPWAMPKTRGPPLRSSARTFPSVQSTLLAVGPFRGGLPNRGASLLVGGRRVAPMPVERLRPHRPCRPARTARRGGRTRRRSDGSSQRGRPHRARRSHRWSGWWARLVGRAPLRLGATTTHEGSTRNNTAPSERTGHLLSPWNMAFRVTNRVTTTRGERACQSSASVSQIPLQRIPRDLRHRPALRRCALLGLASNLLGHPERHSR